MITARGKFMTLLALVRYFFLDINEVSGQMLAQMLINRRNTVQGMM